MAEIKMYKSIFNENAAEEFDEKKKKKDKGEMDPTEQILDILSSKKFSKWFEGKFADYKEGGDEAPSKDDIMADIHETFIAPMEEQPEEGEPADDAAPEEEPAEELEEEEESSDGLQEVDEDWRSQ